MASRGGTRRRAGAVPWGGDQRLTPPASVTVTIPTPTSGRHRRTPRRRGLRPAAGHPGTPQKGTSAAIAAAMKSSSSSSHVRVARSLTLIGPPVATMAAKSGAGRRRVQAEADSDDVGVLLQDRPVRRARLTGNVLQYQDPHQQSPRGGRRFGGTILMFTARVRHTAGTAGTSPSRNIDRRAARRSDPRATSWSTQTRCSSNRSAPSPSDTD